MPTHRLIANQKSSGERLDASLTRLQPLRESHGDWSRNAYATLIRDGLVLVNGTPSSPRYVLKSGDRIEVSSPLPREKPPLPTASPHVLFENDAFLAIDKPAGLPVHGAPGIRSATLTDWLVETYPGIRDAGEDPDRPGIVHRLDKDTSGVMVIAKTPTAASALKSLFRSRQVEKTYLALVAGRLKEPSGNISAPLGRSAVSGKFRIARKGPVSGPIREAETAYRLIEQFPGCALVELRPKTGRTHQIRVHLSHLGHPIAGDRLYRQKISDQAFPEQLGRQLLHASRLAFVLDGVPYVFEAPLPPDFKDFLGKCRVKNR